MSFDLKKLDPSLLKAAVYGANDGIITTFAVVSGVAGAGLSANVVIILGISNMVADACSMGIGDYLGEKSEQRMRAQSEKKVQTKGLWKTGAVTFGAFVLAGTLPLLPYVIELLGFTINPSMRFPASITATIAALFVVGSLRTVLTKGSWLKNGLEMLSIGAIAAVVAYALGFGVKQLVGDVGL